MAVGTLGFLAACGDDGADTDGTTEGDADTEVTGDAEHSLGVSFYQYANTYISSVRQALEGVTNDDGVHQLQLNDDEGEQATQNDQLAILIKQGVGDLAVNIVDVGDDQKVLDKADTTELPIVFFNRDPYQEILKSN